MNILQAINPFARQEYEKPVPQDEPIIHTTRGNMRASELDYFHGRVDEVDLITFTDGYKIKGTDEVVRQNSHPLYLCPGQTGKGGRLEQHLRVSGGALPGASPIQPEGASQ